MTSKAIFTLVFLLFLSVVSNAFAGNIRVISPYLGSIANVYEEKDQSIKLEDSGLFKGIYFQWINTERYQWNIFIYHGSDVNYSTVWGAHFISDFYIGRKEYSQYVIGVGFEYIQIDMNAGNQIYPLEHFELLNHILIPYLRFGRYFHFPTKNVKASVLPWAGVQYERVIGEMTIDPPGPFPPEPKEMNIEEDDFFGMAGLNLTATLYHMFDVKCKYYGAFNKDVYLSNVTAMVNLFFTRHWGVSYRFKYMELTVGSNLYHMFGVVAMF